MTTPRPITAAELKVVLLAVQGKSNAEIAAALFRSERTVETHIYNVYERFGLKNRTQLTLWAIKHNIITIDEALNHAA